MKKLLVVIIILGTYIQSYGQVIPPNTNNFDNPLDTIGWSHYALSGIDDWEIGAPSKYNFVTSYTNPNAWVTNLDSSYAANSIRALESPYYNLTDTSSHYILSFYNKRKSIGTAFYKLEYTTDHGSNWLLLDNATSNKKNWQSSNGFLGSIDWTFHNSAIDLFFLQGQDSIKFRFRYTSTTGNQAGWMIDNFSVKNEYYNVIATLGDTITGINKYFTDFTVESNFIFQNQWTNTYYFQSDFYLSNDAVLDAGDILLGSVNDNLVGSNASWDNTFSLPPSLAAGTYYVIYDLDVLDTLVEYNESDNVNYAVMIVDSIYSPPYISHFDTTLQTWNNGSDVIPSTWKRGDPNSFHIEDVRSGYNAWYNLSHYDQLLSPYLDLSSTVNPVICFWHRTANLNSGIRLFKANINGGTVSSPLFSSTFTPAKKERRYDWDCFCEDLSSHNSEISTKLKIEAAHSVVDDIYIGEPLPDVSIESHKKNRFTDANVPQDTLSYIIYNSGLASLISTTTRFYWSTDSMLDIGDPLIGTNIESSIPDTSFLHNKVLYTKPTNLSGKYYIFYKVDALSQVTEMREYDNIGYFEIHQENTSNLPYFNDFETQITGWRHSATLGSDQWEWGVPNGTLIDSSISGTKAFVTNLNGNIDTNSRMHLYTPIFDLTQLTNPVLEFDLIHYNNGNQTYNAGNIMCSVNGGKTWELVDTTNKSFKRMYYPLWFNDVFGLDYPSNYNSNLGDYFYGIELPKFRYQIEYQGRDYDDNHHYVVDLKYLQEHNQIQFMFVYFNVDVSTEGMMIDNFEIREAEIDLMNITNRKLMVSGTDENIRQYFTLKNKNNYISAPTEAKVYCSADTLFGGTDSLIGTYPIPELKPYQKYLININAKTPSNYATQNYLLINIDPNNIVAESNESNNIDFLELNMDTASNFNYPVLFDFNGDEINGWTWYHDSSETSSTPNGHRFRHKQVLGDFVVNAQDGEWFLDPMDKGTTVHPNNFNHYFPHHYLESPSFDFSNLAIIETQFDFICVGQHSNTGSTALQGGNMQYSTDGGLNWNVLPVAASAQNWYNLASVASLNGEPGWGAWTLFTNWTQGRYDLSFLAGMSSVRLRFHYRSTYAVNPYVNHGFRLDNFKITGYYLAQVVNLNICDNDSALIFGNYENTSGSFYDTIPSPLGDSIFSINLIVDSSFHINQNASICPGDSIFLGGSYQNSSGVFIDSLQTILGCDSILSTTLTVNPLFSINQNNSICQGDSLLLGGLYQTTNGTYVDSLQTINGCDSILTTTLIINSLPSVSLANFNPDTLCINASSVTLPNGSPSGGNYSGNGVVSVNFDPSTAGVGTHYVIYTYTDTNSCVNNDTTIITVDICAGIDNTSSDFGILIYPNPSTGLFTIEKPSDLNKGVQVKLLDATSKLILEKVIPLEQQKVEMDIRNYSKGIYYLKLIVDDEQFVKQILKN